MHVRDDLFYCLFAVFSATACFTIVLSVVCFKELSKRYYIRLILYVTVSDLLCTLPFAFGSQENGSIGCNAQALFANYFALTSILWTVAIVWQLYDVVVALNHLSSEPRYFVGNLLCWGIPLFASLLPLTTDQFGVYESASSDNDRGYCGIIS